MNTLSNRFGRCGICALLLAALTGSAAQPDSEALHWLQRAEGYYQQQDWKRSQEAAEQALQRDPHLAGALVILALVETNQAQLDQAEKHLRAAAAIQPNDPRIRSYLGSTLLREQKYQEAEAEFKTVLRLDQGNVVAAYNLGLIALAGRKPADAKARFRRVLDVHPSDLPARLGVLECDLMLVNKAAVASTLRSIDALLPAGDPERLRLAATLMGYGEFEHAIAVLEKLRTVHPGLYDVHYVLALANLRAGRTELAAARAQEAIRIQPLAAAYHLLAAIREKQNQTGEAIDNYAKAAALEPRNEDYRLDYASAVLEHGKAGEAAALWTAACRDFPQSWRMLIGSGAASFLTGDSEGAVNQLLRAAQLNPDAQRAYALLGQLYELAPRQSNEIEQALADYAHRRPGDASALYHYGRIQYLKAASGAANFDSASQSLRQALAINPHLAEASLQLGIVAQAQGQVAESAKLLQQAVHDDPKLADAHYRLGLVYRKLGLVAQSKAEMALFEKLRADPSASLAHQTVKQLSTVR